ncbi:MAG: HD domain-containing protein [Robiginitalea sp.]|uniref:HD domain-containing protein n=1 Tax=Robiginitalea sp. TaxID=1902411 RepID=UPI003C75A440
MKRSPKLKLFNDPIYGFIPIPNNLIFDLIAHPYFQRLRRISQMGLSYLVYPGAHHTRFHHALGAMHLMQQAIAMLRQKDVEIDEQDAEGLLCAILLHDIGHGPFSHALENELFRGMDHELLSLRFMEELNIVFEGQLQTGIDIFQKTHPRPFLNQLVSGQIDMDRMDYLKRDSFYTGVAEGNINAERLIAMLSVYDGNLVVDAKGIYSVEKFLMARRFMYWQVYLHKTSLAAEQLLIRIIRRARQLYQAGALQCPSEGLAYFLSLTDTDANFSGAALKTFALLDDVDILAALKSWQQDSEPVLALLCEMILDRKLPSIKIKDTPIEPERIMKKKRQFQKITGFDMEEVSYFVFSGEISNQTYSPETQILILEKNGEVSDVARHSRHLNLGTLSETQTRYYICYPKKGI